MDTFVQTAWGAFQWDSNKATANMRKHGIEFSDALGVFQDMDRLEFYDEVSSREEDRFKTL